MMVRPGVSVRILKGLVGATDSVTAFNDSDMVVGMRIQSPTSMAFRWTVATGPHFLPMKAGWNGEAFAVNDSGTVVGDMSGVVSNESWQLPTRWPLASGLQIMNLLTPWDSLGSMKVQCVDRGINAEGMSAGWCFVPLSFQYYVTTWAPSGAVSDECAAYCPVAGQGYAISSRQAVAGGPALDYPFLKAFVFVQPSAQDTLPKLTPPASSFGADIAFAINARGTTAGSAWVANGTNCSDPVVWLSFFQKPKDIGIQFCGQANGVDDNNVVIGTLLLQPGVQAFIWTASTGTQALPGLGGSNESSQAVAINNRREVLGTITSSGTKYDVIWTF